MCGGDGDGDGDGTFHGHGHGDGDGDNDGHGWKKVDFKTFLVLLFWVFLPWPRFEGSAMTNTHPFKLLLGNQAVTQGDNKLSHD